MDNEQYKNPEEEEDYQDLFKGNSSKPILILLVVLVGDAGVGKTHLMNRYVKGQLPKNIVPTIGIEFAAKTVQLKNETKIKAQIWDTAGQERYRGITSTHFRRAGGALVVYDITKQQSYDNVSKWIDDLKQQAEPDIVIMLVGNKVDLVAKNNSARKVQHEEALNYAKSHSILFQETSAVTGEQVIDCFEKLLETMYNNKKKTGGATQERGKKLSNNNQLSDNDCKC